MARFTFSLQPRRRPPFWLSMHANNTRTIPAPALDRPTIPAPPSARDLVEACRPDLRLPSDALAQAALAVVRDAVEAEVDAMFDSERCACEHPEEPGRPGREMCEIDDGELEDGL